MTWNRPGPLKRVRQSTQLPAFTLVRNADGYITSLTVTGRSRTTTVTRDANNLATSLSGEVELTFTRGDFNLITGGTQ